LYSIVSARVAVGLSLPVDRPHLPGVDERREHGQPAEELHIVEALHTCKRVPVGGATVNHSHIVLYGKTRRGEEIGEGAGLERGGEAREEGGDVEEGRRVETVVGVGE
jgi:hypothetical protein